MSNSDASTGRPKAAFLMRSDLVEQLFTNDSLRLLSEWLDIEPDHAVSQFDDIQPDHLEGVRLLITGWGSPVVDGSALMRMPELSAIVHAAGTVKNHVSAECWDQGVAVSSAAEANARPVAEFSLAFIIQAAKQVHRFTMRHYRDRGGIDFIADGRDLGALGTSVGVVGASKVGRNLLRLLEPFEFDVAIHDPYLTPQEVASFASRGVEALGLEALASRSSILTLHAPATPSTRHMIDARILSMLPSGATVINTARGSLIDQQALLGELSTGRLSAILDVVTPHDRLDADSPLWDLDNVVLTPHMAGAFGRDLFRIGNWVVQEVDRWMSGDPFRGGVERDSLDHIA